MLGREEHNEMVGSMNDLIAQIRQAIENGDQEGALSLLDKYEQQAGEEEAAETEGLEGEGLEGEGQEETAEQEAAPAPAPMKKPAAVKPQIPNQIKNYMGM